MSKHVGEECGKLCISSILSSKRGITPTKIKQIYNTQTWSVVQDQDKSSDIEQQPPFGEK